MKNARGNVTTNLIAQDPKWDAILAKIPEDIIDPRDRPRLARTLAGIAEGKSWGDLAPTGLSKPEYVWLKLHSPDFKVLAVEAEKVRDEIRQMEREEEAHDRAVKGEKTPTVAKDGSIVDWYPKRSDRLMELLLKANDSKYRESKANSDSAGKVVLNVSFAIPSRTPKIVEGETVNAKKVKEIKGTKESRGLGKDGPGPADGRDTKALGPAPVETGGRAPGTPGA